MPEVSLSAYALGELQRILRDEGYEAPDEIPSPKDLLDAGEIPDPETYPHEVAEEEALKAILEACRVCGDPDCDRGTAYVGAAMIHADKHPENRAARARERDASWTRQHDPEITECRDCGTEFDLARQNYYDNRCPSCHGGGSS